MITLDALRDVPLLAELNDKELKEFARMAADVSLNAGEWLINEGDAAAFFLLLTGEIEVTKRFGRTEQVLTRYVPGDYFGEVPLLLGSPAFANLRAVTDVRLARLERADFHHIILHCQKLAGNIMQTMTRRVGNIQRVSAEAPEDRVLIVGHAADVECFGLRQFLSANHIDFRWKDPDDVSCGTPIPEIVGGGPYPAVMMPDGEVLKTPTKRELAGKFGLQTAPSQSVYDVVIIGGGPAGLAAAVYGASEGLSTLLLDREAPGGQAGESSRIENYLGFPNGLSGSDLSGRALYQAQRFGAEIVVTRTALGIDMESNHRRVLLDGGDSVTGRTIVISTGVSWRSLPVPGADKLVGCGIYYGAARTEAMGVRGKDVYLIGGGNSAGQAAMFFSDYAHSVTLLIRADSIEKGMSQYLIDQLRRKSNAHIRCNTSVIAVHGEEHLDAITVQNSVTKETECLETTALFVFIGADAETCWIPNEIARDERGYILTGPEARASGRWPRERDPFLLETSAPCIFAAGDVRAGSIKRVASSVGEGSMAIAFIHQCLAVEGQTGK